VLVVCGPYQNVPCLLMTVRCGSMCIDGNGTVTFISSVNICNHSAWHLFIIYHILQHFKWCLHVCVNGTTQQGSKQEKYLRTQMLWTIILTQGGINHSGGPYRDKAGAIHGARTFSGVHFSSPKKLTTFFLVVVTSRPTPNVCSTIQNVETAW